MKAPDKKASGIFAGDTLGSAFLNVTPDNVLEFHNNGYISRAISARALEQAADLLAQHPDVRVLLFDTLAMTGHDPGNAAVIIRWVNTHRERIDRVAVVARSQMIIGLVNMSRVLVPGLEVCLFATRAEAAAWCTQARPRVTTGRRSSVG